jgi:2',3'-cyclic-nucleotide 2'-phosphodiesterase (5'-nucleotidase family)
MARVEQRRAAGLQRLEMKYDSSKPVGQRVAVFTLNGKPIDDATVYHIATNSFLADGGDGFVAFTEGQARIPPAITFQMRSLTISKRKSANG